MTRWPVPRRSAAREAARWFARNRGGAADARAFERWRTADPAHAAAYARLEGHFAATAGIARTPPARRLRVAPPLAAALALGLLAMLAPAVLGDGAVRTEVAEQRALALDDGSQVILDTATTLDPAFDAGERRLRLRSGRARFAVAHGDPRPFVVEAGEVEVVATGTRFDVRLEHGRVEVVLIDGRVELRGTGAPRALAPGERALADGPSLKVAAADLAAADAWPRGRLVFSEAPLATVVAEANRYARRPIVLADAALGSIRVTGSFAADDTPAIARTLAASLRLDVSEIGGELVLTAALRRTDGPAD